MLSTDRAAIVAARAVLDDLEYARSPLVDRLGTGPALRVDRDDLPAIRLRLRDDRPLDVLASLLLLEQSIPIATARAVLGDALSVFEDSGLALVDDESVRSAAVVVPHDDLLIASDRHDRSTRADIVPGVQRPSDLLARLTIRRSVDRALDLGTGCGIQAVLLSRHCANVIATDISERALSFARFNAALNGATNIEFRQGSLLEPVSGERFDLVVSNPPYVISPERRFVFRDSGRRGDELCRELIDALPDYMNDGGLATVLISWAEKVDASTVAPAEWLGERGWSGIVLSGGLQEPEAAAVQWNQGARDDAELFATRVREWMQYFETQGIQRIAYGGVVLARRSGTPWVLTLPLPPSWSGPAGDHLERIVATMRVVTEGGVGSHPIALASDAELVQVLRPQSGGLAFASAELRLRDGLGYQLVLDQDAMALVLALAQSPTLDAACVALASLVGRPQDEVKSAASAFFHELLTFGFVKVL